MNTNFVQVACTHSSGETKHMGTLLAAQAQPGDVVVLTGDLGAGKTQFVQGVARGLGVQAPVTSPTFNILLTYAEGRLPLYHFDLYRLENDDELEDIGFFETVEGDGISFVEWGEKFPDALPYDYLEICLTRSGDGRDEVLHVGACDGYSGEVLVAPFSNAPDDVCAADFKEAPRCIEVCAHGSRSQDLLAAWVSSLQS